jgi:hypothetical protein
VGDEKVHSRALFVSEHQQAGEIGTYAVSHAGADAVLVGSADGVVERWAEGAFEKVLAWLRCQRPTRTETLLAEGR